MNQSARLLRIAVLFALVLPPLVFSADKPKEKSPDKPSPDSAATYGVADERKTGRLPDHSTGLAELAAQAFAKRDWDKARAQYLEMLKAEPDNPLTLANIGAVEQQSGRLKEARNYMLRAVKINPQLQQTWLALGIVAHEMGDSYFAVSALSRAVHEEPTDARAHNYLAVVTRALGWLDAAESELQRAIELKPDYANAHFNLALMYLDRKPPALELAKRHYEKAVALGAERDDVVDEKLKGK